MDFSLYDLIGSVMSCSCTTTLAVIKRKDPPDVYAHFQDTLELEGLPDLKEEKSDASIRL